MSRVLVSFLGTSRPEKTDSGYRQYRRAKYTFPDGECIESSFVALALKKHYQIDKIILIGTPKSMWEEVYYAFSGCIDDVYAEIGEFCESANHKTKLDDFPHINEIEKSLGNGSKVVLVNYGLDSREMDENSKKVLSLEQFLEPNDELFVDITHSFRSLPLLLMNSLIFLRNVSSKRISICSISYGMLDITQEMGRTPVIEMKSILEINDWISGASEFMGSGNAYKIADLLDGNAAATQSDLYAAKVLREFSDVLNFNYIGAIQEQVKNIRKINFEQMSEYGRLIAKPIVDAFLDRFKRAKLLSQYQYYLAEFQFAQRHYAAASLCLSEAYVSFMAECVAYKVDDKQDRLRAKNLLIGKCGKQNLVDPFFENNCSYLKKNGALLLGKKALGVMQPCDESQLLKLSLRKCYTDVTDIRNEVAHSLKGDYSLDTMIKTIRDNLQYVKPYIVPDRRK